MLAKTIAAMLTEQINKELYSAYLYLDMANFYAGKGLMGYEHWFSAQAQEEVSHAMKIRQYLGENNNPVKLSAIADPSHEYKSLREPLVKALEHEQYVTSSINAIYEEAVNLKDYRTQQFLDWFVKEQGEEELNAQTNLDKFDAFGGEPQGLYLLDKEVAGRA